MPRGLFRVFTVLVAAGLVTALTACGKKPPVTPVPPPPPPPVVNVPPPAPPPPEPKPAGPASGAACGSEGCRRRRRFSRA